MSLILSPLEVSVIKKIIPILSVFFIIGMMYLHSPYKELKDTRSCSVHIAETTAVNDFIYLQGTVVERCRRKLYPHGVSRILSIHVQPGQKVAKGDTLMTLRTEDVDAAAVFYAELEKELQDLDTNGITDHFSLPTKTETGMQYDLVSPIDGIVMEIANGAGETVSGIFPCIVVSDLTQLGVSARISEANSNRVTAGMDCRITIASVSDIPFRGHISLVAPYAAASSVLEQNAGVYVNVEAEIADETEMIRPGSSADLKIQTSPSTPSLLLPYHCVAQDERGEYVLYFDHSQIIKRADIKTGRELQDGIEILEGVSAGQWIIENPENYTEGERVRIG